jgi:endonuclease/exonuclease/phosphatase family metal-dependent hydrolase
MEGTEYLEYIPNTGYGWTKDIANIKYTNIARVIKDLGGDVVALQEVESKKALITLRDKLKDFGVDYRYLEIADSRATTVKCAVLSKFPIVEKEEIQVDVDNEVTRNILKITLDIDGNRIILFINHWKSKQGPESMRIGYAKALRREIDKLKENIDFILIGDFNSNYNEYNTFRKSGRLNDTNGITGINHILKTIKDSEMVNEKILTKQAASEYLYNLWLEVSKTRRWSYNFFGEKGSPDNIIVSKGSNFRLGFCI